MPVTLALLRLDPIWDPLRGDPVFQKLCEEKKPLNGIRKPSLISSAKPVEVGAMSLARALCSGKGEFLKRSA